MDEAFLRVVAFHEAGHLAADLYFEHRVDVATIDASGRAAGHVEMDRSGHDALRYEDDVVRQVPFERMIMSIMAGEAAQRIVAPETAADVEQFEGDRRLALEYFEALDVADDEELMEAYWRLLELRTKRLVELLWPKIEALAQALLDRRILSGTEAEEVFCSVPASASSTPR